MDRIPGEVLESKLEIPSFTGFDELARSILCVLRQQECPFNSSGDTLLGYFGASP